MGARSLKGGAGNSILGGISMARVPKMLCKFQKSGVPIQ